MNGAWYRAELAYSLGELGLDVRGGQGKDGRYFEVAGCAGVISRSGGRRGRRTSSGPRGRSASAMAGRRGPVSWAR